MVTIPNPRHSFDGPYVMVGCPPDRHSFNGPVSGGVSQAGDLQRRSCFEMSGLESEMGPTFVEEEPDYAQAGRR